jgi:phosphatidylglycerol lysyltransferase
MASIGGALAEAEAGPSGGVGWRRIVRRTLPPLLILAVFGAAIWAVTRELEGIGWHVVVKTLHMIPLASVLLAVLATAGSYAALCGYDFAAIRHLGLKVPGRHVLTAAFCGYAVGNSVGGMLTASTIRYRVYSGAGVPARLVASIAAFCVVAFSIGIAATASVAALVKPGPLADTIGIGHTGVAAAAGLLLAAVAGGLVACIAIRRPIRLFGRALTLPSGRIAALQLILSAVELAFAGTALWVLLPSGTISFPAFMSIYLVATAAGIASHVPGGLGVFESIMLVGLAGRVEAGPLFAAVVAYRAIYHLLPLALATALLAAIETARATRRIRIPAALADLGSIASGAAPTVAATAVFVIGALLLVSAVTPTKSSHLDLLQSFVPLAVVETSHLGASVLALVLMLVAAGLRRRQEGAFQIAIFALLASALLAIGKGFAWREAVGLVAGAAILWACRRRFRRRSALTGPWTGPEAPLALVGVLGGAAWLMFFAWRHVEYAHDLWWTFEFREEAPRALRAMALVSALAVLFGIRQLLRVPVAAPRHASAIDLARAAAIARTQPFADANLVRLRDKALLFSEDNSAFLMYGVQGHSWIALGDPVGPRAAWPGLIWRFHDAAEAAGCRAAWYGVRTASLPLYLDAGLALQKLGEEARIELASFTLSKPRFKPLRYALSRGLRDGLTFELLDGRAAIMAVMPELRRISDCWLAARAAREKRFSLGAFDEDYVAGGRVALVRQDGLPVAFATLLETTQKLECAADLMRHGDGVSAYAMDFLFAKLLLAVQEEGVAVFSLGMAPLAGMQDHPLAPLWHRLAGMIYRHGRRFYNFEGLRAFKQKFDPAWEPRYLASVGGTSAAIVLSDVAVLIGGGLKGLLAK